MFNVESGIIASWLTNCGDEYQTELFPYRPEVVGQAPAQIVMGKGSGIDSVKPWLERFQIQASEDQAMEVLQAVKKFGIESKRLMTEDEFRTLANETISGVNVA